MVVRALAVRPSSPLQGQVTSTGGGGQAWARPMRSRGAPAPEPEVGHRTDRRPGSRGRRRRGDSPVVDRCRRRRWRHKSKVRLTSYVPAPSWLLREGRSPVSAWRRRTPTGPTHGSWGSAAGSAWSSFLCSGPNLADRAHNRDYWSPLSLARRTGRSDAIFGRSKQCPRAGGVRAPHRLSGCASIICGVGSGRLLDQNFLAFQRQIRRFGAQTVSWAGSTLPHRQRDPRCVPSQSQPRELQRIGAINPPMLLLDQVAVISK